MKKCLRIGILLAILQSTTVFALEVPQPVQPVGPFPQLNEISFNVSVEQWVNTLTAKVIVGVDANLDQAGLDKLQGSVLASLKQFSKEGEWRITVFSRAQNQSELETVYIEAEARLPQSQLANIRSSAKSLSKPGMKYSIRDIQYTPSLEEIEKVRVELRHQLYQKIKMEVDEINKTFPTQPFYIHQLNFSENGVGPQPAPMYGPQANYKVAARAAEADMPASSGFDMSQKITMSATAIAASSILVK